MQRPAVFTRVTLLAGAAVLASLASNGCSNGALRLPSNGGASGAGGAQDAVAGVAAGGNGAVAQGGRGGAAGGNGDNVAGTAGTASGGGAGGATAGGSAGAGEIGGGGAQTSPSNGCIVPLYSYPSAPAWNAIVQAKQAHPAVGVVAIVNPSSGPGVGVDGSFTTGIAKLVAAAIVPIGYISTNYTKRGQAAVKADTDTWRASYPAVQGIFFDEQSSTPGDEAFYSAVSDYAKTKGFTLTVGNPGTGVPNSFLGTVDVMLSYESAGAPKLASLGQYAAHRDQFGIIPYAATFDATYVKAAATSVRYVYLTDDDLPNPWDTLASYFDPLLGALAP